MAMCTHTTCGTRERGCKELCAHIYATWRCLSTAKFADIFDDEFVMELNARQARHVAVMVEIHDKYASSEAHATEPCA